MLRKARVDASALEALDKARVLPNGVLINASHLCLCNRAPVSPGVTARARGTTLVSGSTNAAAGRQNDPPNPHKCSRKQHAVTRISLHN